MKSLTIGFLALLAATALAYAAEPATVVDSSKGKIWADAKGMALYTFDKDETGKTNCYDDCAKNWPPLMAEASAMAIGEWTVVDRTDGTKMWAYDGHPLYTFIGDKAAGEVNGDGKGGVWHVANGE